MFSAYTLDFKRVNLMYIDYLNAKVCASEYVDYDKHVMKPDANGEVEVKYRMKRKMVKVEEVELIDLYNLWRPSKRRKIILKCWNRFTLNQQY